MNTRQQPIKRPSNAERYQHIPIARIIELFDQGLSHRKIGKVLGMGPCAVGKRLRREGRVRTRPGLTGEDLEDARLDCAWEARHGLANRVVCRVCGKFMAAINANSSHSHLRTHHMTADEYASKYPGARFTRAADQSRRQGREGDVQKFMEAFARRYLTASELIECRKDHEFEKRRGFDFVVCRDCGLKSSKTELWMHLRRHGYSGLEEYRAEWSKAPYCPPAIVRYRNEYAKTRYADQKAYLQNIKQKAWRPDGWENWTGEQKAVGIILIDNPGMKPRALGIKLDDSRLACLWGDSWERAFTTPGTGRNWLDRLRKRLVRL